MQRLLVVVLSLLFLAGCEGKAPQSELPTFDDPQLTLGMNTWMQVCRNCHLTGVAGAPAIHDADAWQARMKSGREKLYKSALNGIATDSGWSMPPKGGMQQLSDQQVKLAVDYMLAAQQQLITEQRP